MKRSVRIVCAILIAFFIAQAFLGCSFVHSPYQLEHGTTIPAAPSSGASSETAGAVQDTDIPNSFDPYSTAPSESSAPSAYPSIDPTSTSELAPTDDHGVISNSPFIETPSLTAPQTPYGPTPSTMPTPAPTQTGGITPAPATPTPRPTPASTPRPTQPVFTTPDPNMPFDQIQPGDLRIFDYCAFFGNSLFDSLFYNRVITHGAFYTRVGLTVQSAYTLPSTYGSIPVIDELNSGDYTGILLMFGQNELGWTTHAFRTKYTRLIEDVHSRQPKATLLIAGMPPLSKYLSQTSTDGSTNENATIFNRIIEQIASSFDYCRYIEPPVSLYDSEGYLPADASVDGMHLNKTYLAIWAQHLCIATVNELIPKPSDTPTPSPSATSIPLPTPEPSPAPIETPPPIPTPSPEPIEEPTPTPEPIETAPPIVTSVPKETPVPTPPPATPEP